MTDSMKKAIGETERRRNKQIAHNLAQGITPIGVSKKIKDIIEGIYNPDTQREMLMAAQEGAKYDAMSEKQMTATLKKLEKQMLDHAKNLEFEQAAKVRDQLKTLKQKLFVNPE